MPAASLPARQRLADAAFALILEHGFDGLTVGRLLDRAGVARSSFYAHFRDKEDLLLHGFDSLGPSLVAHEGSPAGFARWLFATTDTHRRLASVLLAGSARELVCQHLENTLIVRLRDQLRRDTPARGFALELRVRHHVSALLGLWRWWIDHDYPLPAEAMADEFGRLSGAAVDPQ